MDGMEKKPPTFKNDREKFVNNRFGVEQQS